MIPSEDYTQQKLIYSQSRQGLWRIIGYCAEPTITMENMITGQRECFGLSGLTAATFEPIPNLVVGRGREAITLEESDPILGADSVGD